MVSLGPNNTGPHWHSFIRKKHWLHFKHSLNTDYKKYIIVLHRRKKVAQFWNDMKEVNDKSIFILG